MILYNNCLFQGYWIVNITNENETKKNAKIIPEKKHTEQKPFYVINNLNIVRYWFWNGRTRWLCDKLKNWQKQNKKYDSLWNRNLQQQQKMNSIAISCQLSTINHFCCFAFYVLHFFFHMCQHWQTAVSTEITLATAAAEAAKKPSANLK